MSESVFQEYMLKVQAWAEAYDREAIRLSKEEFDALYNDEFFEALALAEKLP